MIINKVVDDINYVYDENFWTGKKRMYINGKEMRKIGKKEFTLSEGETTYVVQVKGSFFAGVTLYVNSKPIELVKNKWYEWILIFIPFLSLAVGVFGGAIGGALSAIIACTGTFINATICRSKLNVVVKVILCILIAVASGIAWWLLYAFIVSLLL